MVYFKFGKLSNIYSKIISHEDIKNLNNLLNNLYVLKKQLEVFIKNIRYLNLHKSGKKTSLRFPGLTNPYDTFPEIIHFGVNKKLNILGTTHCDFFEEKIPNKLSILIHVYYSTRHEQTEFAIMILKNHDKVSFMKYLSPIDKRFFCLWHLFANKDLIVSPNLSKNQLIMIDNYTILKGNYSPMDHINDIKNKLDFLVY